MLVQELLVILTAWIQVMLLAPLLACLPIVSILVDNPDPPSQPTPREPPPWSYMRYPRQSRLALYLGAHCEVRRTSCVLDLPITKVPCDYSPTFDAPYRHPRPDLEEVFSRVVATCQGYHWSRSGDVYVFEPTNASSRLLLRQVHIQSLKLTSTTGSLMRRLSKIAAVEKDQSFDYLGLSAGPDPHAFAIQNAQFLKDALLQAAAQLYPSNWAVVEIDGKFNTLTTPTYQPDWYSLQNENSLSAASVDHFIVYACMKNGASCVLDLPLKKQPCALSRTMRRRILAAPSDAAFALITTTCPLYSWSVEKGVRILEPSDARYRLPKLSAALRERRRYYRPVKNDHTWMLRPSDHLSDLARMNYVVRAGTRAVALAGESSAVFKVSICSLRCGMIDAAVRARIGNRYRGTAWSIAREARETRLTTMN